MVAGWIERLGEAIERHCGPRPALLAAVSGGGDSVALLHGLVALREPLGLSLTVGHLDHGLRDQSAAEAAFVGRLGLESGLLVLRESADVAAVAAREGLNLEEAARRCRYAMLDDAARAVGAGAIVTAHTADDQAESLLMHLLRGAGLDGLSGMRAYGPSPLPGRETPLLRPLLSSRREELRAWLREGDHEWLEDASNEDPGRFRARLRGTIIPVLEREQPALVERLLATAETIGVDLAYLERATEESWTKIVERRGESLRLDRAAFLALDEAIRRRLLRRAFFTLRPQARDLSHAQVAHALEVAAGASDRRAVLPGGLFLFVEPDVLWVGSRPGRRHHPLIEREISLPDTGRQVAAGLEIEIDEVGRGALPDDWTEHDRAIALLDAAALKPPLRLRPPERGDRWTPLGMAGREPSLRGWMARHGVPVAIRDRVPLLVDGTDRILWVVGWEIAERARVRDTSRRLLRIRVERHGDGDDES